MAIKEEVVISVSTDSSQAEGSVKSLKTQLREAQAEVAKMAEKFGDTSREAMEAARRAAMLKDKIGDAKGLTDAFNPDKKFSTLANVIQGVAGGFAAVTGAMGLFGAENEKVEQTLKKVNSAMALVSGLNAVTNSIDSFKKLGADMAKIPIIQKVITAAQWLWNAAMNANPIGAITVAITALIAGITALVYWFKSSADESAKQKKQIDASSRALDELKKSTEKANQTLDMNQKHQLAMAKATGKSAEEIRKLELKLADEKIATAKATAETAKNTLERQKNALAILKQQDADSDRIKEQEAVVDKAKDFNDQSIKNLESAETEKTQIVYRQEEERAQAITDANNKSIQDAESTASKKKQQQDETAKKIIEDTKKLNEDLEKINQENTLTRIKDDRAREQAKLEIDLENQKKEIEKTQATTKAKNALIAALEEKYMLDLGALKDKYAEEDKKKREEQLAKELKAESDTFDMMNQARWAKMKDQIQVSQEMEAVRYQKEIDDLIKSLNDKEITQEQYDNKREAAKILHEKALDNIDTKIKEERQKKLEKENKIEKETFDLIQQARWATMKDQATARLEQEFQRYQYEQDALLDALNKKEISQAEYDARAEAYKDMHEKKLTDIEKQNKEERIKLAEEEYQKKLSIYNLTGNAMSVLSDAIGKTTAVGKSLALAELAINTGVALSGIIRQASKNPTNLTPFQLVADIAIRSAAVIANIKKAKDLINSAKTGGGGDNGGNMPTPSLAPIAPQMSSTAMNQQMINQMGNASTRAFVLESDVSGNQERIRRLNRAARIN